MPEDTPSKPEPKGLKSTLNLPQTPFPMKANLPVNEPLRLAKWQEEDLYGQIRAARAGAPKYILHDGPPYANGAIHLGHALNKCIKDFVVKTKTMAGFDAPYVPGWDCHGLPIEIKVDDQLGRKKLEMDPLAVRQACRAYAQKYVDLQRSQFERIGVFGRWNDPYLTMSNSYESKILESFYSFFEQGFVYKGLKPVFWCIHDRTALAEAEVEYEQHTSPSVYIRYKLTSDPSMIHPELGAPSSRPPLGAKVGEAPPIYTIIWTTTPWTIPASQAVAFNPQLEYVALHTSTGTYIVAQALLSAVITHCNLMSATHPEEPASQADIVGLFSGQVLDRATFQHPFFDRSILGVLAPYVTADQGTGAVHTAPAHGVDDFYTGKRYDLPELQYVDNAGKQRNTGVEAFEGLTVFKSNASITELLREKGALLAATHFEHSYPHCWRCHNPVIVRATEQWFIGMETPMPAPTQPPPPAVRAVILSEAKDPDTAHASTTAGTFLPQNPASAAAQTTFRQRALQEIDKVVWDPSWGKERISNMIATRPDWCISRQRIWGVPIAVFLCEQCGEPLNDPAINQSVVARFERESADAWYKYSPEELLPQGAACSKCSHSAFRKEMDILDVWFESGSSWHAVLEADPELRFPADLYTEGGDQHRGWFHSSLLTSVAMRNQAPYKMVATSGWTLDEQGRAFSKSLGNGVDPVDIAKRLGGEIIRLWVASVDFREDVAASENLMQRVSDNYRKLRNTLRFLLSNLYDFIPAEHEVKFDAMEYFDQGILIDFDELRGDICGQKPSLEDEAYFDEQAKSSFIQNADSSFFRTNPGTHFTGVGFYAKLEFHRAFFLINKFCVTNLSSFYLDKTKDRLYTFGPNSPGRRSAQTAMFRMLRSLTKMIAPILSFTAEEAWSLIPNYPGKEASVHVATFDPLATSQKERDEFNQVFWTSIPVLGTLVDKKLDEARKSNIIGKPLEAEVTLYLDSKHEFVRCMQHVLPEIFNVSQVQMEGGYTLDASVQPASGTKCERCWRYTVDVADDPAYPAVCLRCAEALHALNFPPYEKPVESTV